MLPFPYLSAETLLHTLPMEVAIAAMRAAFGDDTEIPVRVLLGNSLFMPARVGRFTGIKVVSIKAGNPMGTVTLYDADGSTVGMVNGAALTSLRTGAASGLATELLSPRDAATLAMLGAGVVSAHQIEAVCCVRPIRTITIWSRSTARAHTLANTVRQRHPAIQVVVSEDANAAVAQADVICCATPSRQPLFEATTVRAGTHINAVGAFTPEMTELPSALLRTARVFVDNRQAAAVEAGDLLQAHRDPDGELGDILADRMPGRENTQQITVFKSVGIASQDVAGAVAALLGIEALRR